MLVTTSRKSEDFLMLYDKVAFNINYTFLKGICLSPDSGSQRTHSVEIGKTDPINKLPGI